MTTPVLRSVMLDCLDARVLLDRTEDPEEPLWVFADPAGHHPFCIFVA